MIHRSPSDKARRLVLAATIVSALAAPVGCARNGHQDGSRQDASAPLPPVQAGDSVLITLARTPCFGTCPVYSLTLSADGTVRYDGRRHVRHVGSATARIGADSVAALLDAFRSADYFALADQYTRGAPTCPRWTTDSPSAITSLTLRGRAKRIEHDYGCTGVPSALTELERTIDVLVGSSRWTGVER